MLIRIVVMPHACRAHRSQYKVQVPIPAATQFRYSATPASACRTDARNHQVSPASTRFRLSQPAAEEAAPVRRKVVRREAEAALRHAPAAPAQGSQTSISISRAGLILRDCRQAFLAAQGVADRRSAPADHLTACSEHALQVGPAVDDLLPRRFRVGMPGYVRCPGEIDHAWLRVRRSRLHRILYHEVAAGAASRPSAANRNTSGAVRTWPSPAPKDVRQRQRPSGAA